jgi:hypothetical protein
VTAVTGGMVWRSARSPYVSAPAGTSYGARTTWTLHYSANGKQPEKSFADKVNPNHGRADYDSGKKLAEDFRLKLTHDKR